MGRSLFSGPMFWVQPETCEKVTCKNTNLDLYTVPDECVKKENLPRTYLYLCQTCYNNIKQKYNLEKTNIE